MAGKILVVDDDPGIRGLVRATLKEFAEVDEAQSGKEALARLADGKYAVVVLDLMMPDVSGFDVLDQIEECQREAISVVIMSAAAPKLIDSSIRPSVRALLRKPFNIDDLSNAVRACFSADPLIADRAPSV